MALQMGMMVRVTETRSPSANIPAALATFVLFKASVMEYVIKLRDKRIYDAVLGFIRTLGLNASEVHTQSSKGSSQSAVAQMHDDAHTLGLAAFDAGFDADEADISDWTVREPNPKYGK